jgi:hypothetical protein
MSTMATPFERVLKMDKPNCDLILAGEDGIHPVHDACYSDWLSKLVFDRKEFTKVIISG